MAVLFIGSHHARKKDDALIAALHFEDHTIARIDGSTPEQLARLSDMLDHSHHKYTAIIVANLDSVVANKAAHDATIPDPVAPDPVEWIRQIREKLPVIVYSDGLDHKFTLRKTLEDLKVPLVNRTDSIGDIGKLAAAIHATHAEKHTRSRM